MNISEIKDQVCDICHKMWQLGWVASNDGNVSAKLDDGTFLVTPTGISKSLITPDKLLIITKDCKIIEGADGYKPSSEIKMHLRCYQDRDDVGGVVHAHPPAATAFAVAHLPMDRYTTIESVVTIGSVPLTLTAHHPPTRFPKQLLRIYPNTTFCSLKTTAHLRSAATFDRILPHGNLGTFGKNQYLCAYPRRRKRNFTRKHRPPVSYARRL